MTSITSAPATPGYHPRVPGGTLKTGRLLKLEREGVSIQAYFYREGSALHASVFVMERGRTPGAEPLVRFSADTDQELERRVRAYVDERWPRRA